MYAIGLMSGTSLDGIDAALVKIEGNGLNTKVKLIEFLTLPLEESIKEEIRSACSEEKSSVDLICSLNFKLGYLFVDAVRAVCAKANFNISDLDYIASHGQTIYHLPQNKGHLVKSTLQIGEPAVIAYETGVKVISNFRTMDMAAGGQGAPLVPYSEYILYGKEGANIALQNIGGIGNVTVISKDSNVNNIFAFDTGPGNMIIDEVCKILYGIPYDNNGEIASQGIIDEKMLDRLMSHPYIIAPIPKTTGREEFGQFFVEKLLKRYSHKESKDILATVTMFTAKSIAENYKKYILPKVNIEKVIIGGGGAHNKTLINYIKKELPKVEVLTQEEFGFSSDAKEAIAFAILGNETIHNNYSNVPNATGAVRSVILGNITNSPFRRSENE